MFRLISDYQRSILYSKFNGKLAHIGLDMSQGLKSISFCLEPHWATQTKDYPEKPISPEDILMEGVRDGYFNTLEIAPQGSPRHRQAVPPVLGGPGFPRATKKRKSSMTNIQW